MEPNQPVVQDALHHPVEVMQANARKLAEQQELQRQAMMFGRGYALRTALAHKDIAEKANWSCGDRTAKVLRAQYDDAHTSIGFEDILGRPQDDPNVQPTVRERMNRAVFGSDLVLKNTA
eukprot:CAMPEP_0174836946 /NCGR_PEP_ID=MMETSP1114-20130205/6407_1 /TAXON_ID=312471 /ORGANISM="Neobodo designis, Strain CCAP 1951/1" /LENGTH=119 /DNA_ID=CAMNT_0016070977 /DNA_START=42 /DNA_END=401 /DNA_ORIENTATION=+